MSCRITELCEKDVINIQNGDLLGKVNDVEFRPEDGKITALIIYGKLKFFGLGKGNEDIKIPWCDIAVIGEDTILVRCAPPRQTEHRKNNPLQGIFSQ